jgi:hypothetical protein
MTMTPKHFVAVGLRLFALWLVWGSIQSFAIATAIERFNPSPGGNSLWIAVIVVIVFLATAALVWMFSASLATAALSGIPQPQNATLSLGHIIVAGCVLMGLWWLKASAIPLVDLWLRAISMSRWNNASAFDVLGDVGKINAALYLVQIACGLFFVLRPFVIARWVIRSIPDSAPAVRVGQSGEGARERDGPL